MPNRVDLVPNKKNRRAYRRNTVIGLTVAASLGLVAGCNNNGSSGTDPDMATSGDPDLALPPNPPPGSFRVSVSIAGAGTGSVASQPGNIVCSGGSTVCAADFVDGTTITLTAAGSNGSAFSSWAGACAGQGATCTLTVNADQMTTASFGPLSCSADGVCWEAPLPFGYDLNSVAAISANNVWAVGNSGTAVRYDGSNWTHIPTGTTADLTDVWARNANDVWATAGAGMMLRWDGTKWNKINTGFPNDITNLVWGTADRLFVPTKLEFVLGFNGTTWTKTSTGTRNDSPLTAISGTSNSDVFVFASDQYITHYNGTNWVAQRTDLATQANYANTSGAFSVAANDVWQVTANGYVGRAMPPNRATATMGFVLQPTRIQNASGFNGLWGTSSTSLFTNGPGAKLYRYNGAQWTGFDTNVKDVTSLSKVHGTSATNVWAVGQRGVIAHFDGTLAAVKRGNIFSGSNMVGVWASGPNDAWFITNAATVVRYNGASFTESAPLVVGGGARLKSIWGTSPTDVWVGGTDGQFPIIKHWDGATWTTTPNALAFNPTAIDAIYAGSKTLAFATGDPLKTVEKWNGTAWATDFTLSATNPLIALWGIGENNVLAIEGSGSTKLWRYNGAAWTTEPGINTLLYSLGGSAADDILAGGNRAVWRFNGTTWTMTALPTAQGTINSVSSVSKTDSWAVDQNGNAFHYDGVTWKQVDTGISAASLAQINAFSVNANLTWLAGRGILSVRK